MDGLVESEFKLRAVRAIEPAAFDAAIREAGFSCRAVDSRHHVDVYLDDARQSLARAGVGLRIREDARSRVVTAKAAARRDGALFTRTETDAPWSPAALPASAADLPAAVRDAVEPFLLDRPLAETLTLATDREARTLLCEDREVCVVVLDRVEARARERTTSFAEVEIEVVDDLPNCERLAQALTERLPVRPAEDDKPSHAAVLLGQAVRHDAPRDFDADTPVADVLPALVLGHLAALRRAETGVRSGDDPRHLHSMRVAVRRLRGLVRAFRDVWREETSAWVLARLGDTGRRLGELRDLDVMIAGLSASIETFAPGLRPAAMRLVPWIEEQRRALQRDVREWLRSPDRLAEMRQLDDRLTRIEDTKAGDVPIGEAIEPRLAKLVEAARRHAAALPHDLPFEPMHALRIAVKRLRYFAEEFATLAPKGAEKSLALAVRLQSHLGMVCDHEQSIQRLLRWVPNAVRTDTTGLTAAALGALVAQHARAARSARKRAVRTLSRFDKKKVWRRFTG